MLQDLLHKNIGLAGCHCQTASLVLCLLQQTFCSGKNLIFQYADGGKALPVYVYGFTGLLFI